MTGPVELRVHEAPDVLELTLAGTINETFELDAVLEQTRGRAVRVVLDGVRRINSAGVREWVRALAALVERAQSVELARCSPALVQQMAMIPSVRAGARVSSIIAPFACDACGTTTQVTLGPGDDVHAARACACGATLELDDAPEPYDLVARTLR